jgi:hypothetical protein
MLVYLTRHYLGFLVNIRPFRNTGTLLMINYFLYALNLADRLL